MPVINIEVLQDILGGTEVVDASITATVNRASIDAYRIDNQFVIFPRDIVIPVVNGEPTVPLVLTVLPPSYYWHIDVFVNGEAPVRRSVIVPGNVGPYDFEDLIDVLPESALPDPGTDAATAYAALVESYAIRAETAALLAEGNLDVTGDLTGTLPDVYLIPKGTAGTYPKVTTDANGRVVSGTTLSESDIPAIPVSTKVTGISATGPATYAGGVIGINQSGFSHISNLSYAQFDITNATAPTQTGRMAWNQTDGALDLKLNDGVTLQVGQETVLNCGNFTGTLIPEGAAVHVQGAQGGKLKVALASASSEGASANTLGIVTNTGGIASGQYGYVTLQGLVRGLHLPTANFAEGDVLWLSTNGGTWSRTRPVAPAHGVQIGYVVSPSNGNNGVIYVHVQNGYELNELHSVLITNPQEGDVLKFRSGLWVNEQP